MKYLLLAACIAIPTISMAQKKPIHKKPSITDSIYTKVDHMPESGDDWFASFGKHFNYPDSATIAAEGIQGKVQVQLVVYEDGHTGNYEVLHPRHTQFEKEVVKAFALMPRWKPGTLHGKAVKVRFVMPINIDME